MPAPLTKTLLENGQAKQATSRKVIAARCIVMLVQQLRRLMLGTETKRCNCELEDIGLARPLWLNWRCRQPRTTPTVTVALTLG